MQVCLQCSARFAGPWRCPQCHWQPATKGDWPIFAPELMAGNSGFSAGFFDELYQAEAQHFWFRSRNQLLIHMLRRYCPDARRLLEIGCGTGYVLTGLQHALPQLECSGSEVFLEGLAFARTRLPNASLSQMSALAIPYDSEFDVIGAFDVLEHLDDDRGAMAQMFQAVRPGGGVLITVPQHRFLWSAVDDHSCHKRRYSRRELADKLTSVGFAIEHMTSFVSLLLPVMLLQRLRRRHEQIFDPAQELQIAAPVNFVLEQIMTLERALLRVGVSLPVGGSLLAVARRPVEAR